MHKNLRFYCDVYRLGAEAHPGAQRLHLQNLSEAMGSRRVGPGRPAGVMTFC